MLVWFIRWRKPLIIIGAILAVWALVAWYGNAKYEQGVSDQKARTEALQIAIERGRQAESDRADAQYRGAILARQQLEKKLSESERSRIATATRLNGLLKQYADRAKESNASSGPDAAGPDWIGIFGECVARSESLGRRLGEVGADAARFADQINGLQGHIRASE